MLPEVSENVLSPNEQHVVSEMDGRNVLGKLTYKIIKSTAFFGNKNRNCCPISSWHPYKVMP